MNKSFAKRELLDQSFFQKLFKIQRKENAIIEINNLFCEKNISRIKIEEISIILEKYKIKNLLKLFPDDCIAFYSNYLNYCLEDKHLSDEEMLDLDNIKFLLRLKTDDVENAFKELTSKIYKEEVAKVISDGKLDKSEEEYLTKLEENFKMNHDMALKIYSENSQILLTGALQKAIADQKLSPVEMKDLELLAGDLHIKLSFDSGTKALLEKYKLFWIIENGELPTVSCDINLQKSENCYFITRINWQEERTVRTRVGYSGVSTSFRICKGVYYRAGTIAPRYTSEDIYKIIDSGKIYLTNKRIIFVGSHSNKNITLKKILDFTVYSNGIDIQKDTGKSPFFEFSENTDIFGALLGRLISEL